MHAIDGSRTLTNFDDRLRFADKIEAAQVRKVSDAHSRSSEKWICKQALPTGRFHRLVTETWAVPGRRGAAIGWHHLLARSGESHIPMEGSMTRDATKSRLLGRAGPTLLHVEGVRGETHNLVLPLL